jgi:hypothetical protein
MTQATRVASTWSGLGASKRDEFIRSVVQRVVIGQEFVWIDVEPLALFTKLLGEEAASALALNEPENPLRMTASFKAIRRRGEIQVVSDSNGESSEDMCIPSLMTAMARAHDWRERIVAGEIPSLQQISQETNLTPKYVRRLFRCANLSPKVTEAILSGTQRMDLKLSELLRGVPLDWAEQKHFLRHPA